MTQPAARASRGARYVRERGGVLYVWLSESGLLDYATNEPPEHIRVRRLSGPGFALHADKQALVGDRVGVEGSLRRPWRLVIGFQRQGHEDAGGASW